MEETGKENGWQAAGVAEPVYGPRVSERAPMCLVENAKGMVAIGDLLDPSGGLFTSIVVRLQSQIGYNPARILGHRSSFDDSYLV